MQRLVAYLGRAFHGFGALGRLTKAFLVVLLIISGAIAQVFSGSTFLSVNWFKLEKDHKAPVDYGYGPGAGIGAPRPSLRLGQTPPIPKSPVSQTPAAQTNAPAGGGAGGYFSTPFSWPIISSASAQTTVPVGGGAGGYFSAPFPWPIIPIQTALLPDGRVISWGTDESGDQGAELYYDVWTPSLGTGTSAHSILPNNTPTDIFCAAASLLSQSPDTPGSLLITGGDMTVNGTRGYSNNNVNIFYPATNTLSPAGVMTYARWYPSIITMLNGDKLVLGGQLTPSPSVGEPTPELRTAATGWSVLTGISLDPNEWYYPRGFVGPDGGTYLFYQDGETFRLTPNTTSTAQEPSNGTGTQEDLGDLVPAGINTFSSTMFFNPTGNPLFPSGNPFTVMLLRYPNPSNGFPGSGNEVDVADISSYPPVVTPIGNLSYVRYTGNLTVLADGTVLASGGSSVFNVETNVAYQVELYNPKTGTWTLGASAAIPRLYHSSTLLLPDGSVLTGGGGAPGPVNELNAEIYYPPYLYLQDGSGNPAPRPTVSSPPSTVNLNQSFLLTVGANDTISAINLTRLGSNTHNFDAEQRLIPVSFSQSGTQITATVNASPEIAPPGYYMIFVLNSSGVPAVAPIVFITPTAQSLPDLTPTSLSYNTATGNFTSVVLNQGAGPVPAGVIIGNGFYVDGNFATWGSVYGPLAAGASVTITSSGGGGPYTIPSGTHTIEVKTNDYGTTGRFVESDPSNNTLSQSITIGGSAPAPTASLTASPTSIVSGNSSTLTWSSTNATSCSGTGFTASGTSGSTSVSPTATTTYTITCSGSGGQQATASATVTVTAAAAPTASLTASPTSIVSGNSSTLSWSSTNATSCSGTGFTASGTSGSTSVSPTATTTYTITCSGSGGQQATASATVTVTATALPELQAYSLSYSSTTGLFTSVVNNIGAAPTPTGVVIGNGFYVDGNFVSWGSVPGPLAVGASVTINSSGGGAYTIPVGTHTITVIVDNYGCCGRIAEEDKPTLSTPTSSDPNNTLSETITIGGSAPTASLTASPTSIVSGNSSTLSWSSTNATSCSGTGFTASGTSGSTSVSPTATQTYTLTCSGPGGETTASATVDVTTTALPELQAYSLSYNSTTGLFTSVVNNIGAAPTPTGVVIGNGFYVDGNFVSWGSVPGPLAVGASVTINSSGGGAYTIPAGTHTITVIVDNYGCCGRIAEEDKPTLSTPTSSDPNNTLSETITVP
jgi:hypothetical protein